MDTRMLIFRKTRHSIGNGDCVEVAATHDSVHVRDSKDSLGPVIRYSVDAWQMFLAAARQGKYDHKF